MISVTPFCKLCGENPRAPEKSRCHPCLARLAREHRAKNLERVRETERESKRKLRAENPEHHAEYLKTWRAENPEKVKAAKQRHYKKYAARIYANILAWNKANPEATRRHRKLYKSRYPEKVSARDARRRARKVQAEGSYTAAEFVAKLKLYKRHCHWCTKKIEGRPHADHLIALAIGGSNDISNIVPSCARCNLSKGAKLPHEFMGRLL